MKPLNILLTRQQEKFIVLMENYGTALEYAAVAADSAGTAQEKFNDAYMDSIEAKINGLTAAWEKFSMTILDSDLVKGFVTVLTGLANALTAISGWADGALVWIPAITAAVLVLVTAIQRAAKSNFVVNLVKNLKGLLAIFPAVTARMQANILNIQAETAARKHNTNALLLETKAKEASKAADVAMKATNPAGWIMLAVSAVVMITQALIKANKAAEEAKKKAKELADQARENTEAAKEETNQIKELIDQYEELAKSNSEGLDYNAETREEIRKIQEEIVKLVGQEAAGLDLLNGKYDEQLDKLSSISKYSYQEQRGNAISALIAAEEAASNMILQDQGDSVFQNSFQNKSDFFTGVLGSYNSRDEAEKAGWELAERFAEATGLELGTQAGETGIHVSVPGNERVNIYFPEIGIDVDTSDPEAALSQLDAIRDFLIEEGLVREYEDMFVAVEAMREDVLEYANNITSAQNDLLDSTVGALGVEDVRDIGSLDEYKDFRETLITNVIDDSEIDKLIQEGSMTREDVAEAVDDWLALYASKWYDALNESLNSNIITSKSFLDILNEVEGEFNALSNAAKSIDENGILGADAIREILEEYEDLERYFEKTDDGYIFGIKNEETGERWNSTDVINAYMQEYLQAYQDEIDKCKEGTDEWTTAVDNYNNALAVSSTLLREVFGEAADPNKSYLEILNEIEGKFNALAEAAENFHEEGIISADAIKKVLEDYEGLEKYFEQTDQGYILGTNPDTGTPWETQDVLKAYVKDYLQGYLDAVNECEEGTDEWTVAANNYNNALSVCTTLLRAFMEAAIDPSKTYLDILNEIEGRFDALSEAAESFEEKGIVASDAIRAILEEYNDLEHFFEKTDQGYILGTNPETGETWEKSDLLNAYVREYLQPYLDAVNECEEGTEEWTIAANNYNNALSACNSLLKEFQEAAIGPSKSYLDVLNEIEGEFNALAEAMQSFGEKGVIGNDAIRSIREEYEELEKYFKLTDQGYIVANNPITGETWETNDILNAYVKEYLQPYLDAVNECEEGTEEWAIAAQNYNNALAVCAVLLRDFQEPAIKTSKDYLDILDEIESEFDALNNALSSFDENGIVSADAIRTILEEYNDLERFFKMTDKGYVLGNNPETGEAWTHNDVLEAYIKEYLQPYLETVNECEEGTDAWTIAVNNYNNALAVCATLLQAAQIQSTEMWETEIDNLEESKDSLEEQLDHYKDIIELRKDLLDSFKEEIDYQTELKEKQEDVANLQTKLSVARLDTSAAGQARVRELEEELEEAQSELDNFTLEHAIDVLTKELDDQYSEYEKFVDSEVTKISDKIASLEQTIKESTDNISVKLDGFESIDIGDSKLPETEEETDVTIDGFEPIEVPNPPESSDNDTDTGIEGYEPIEVPNSGTENEPGKDEVIDIEIDGFKPIEVPETEQPSDDDSDSEEDKPEIDDGKVDGVKPPKKPIVSGIINGNHAINIADRDGITAVIRRYHDGGFVGGSAGLKSNEEFAKLMKTEFVSTPKQITNFMTKTLPTITGSGSSAQFNAPLISIQCDSMSEETYPKVKQLVNQAVDKVKQQIDSVFSRTGYKGTTKFNI